MERMFPTMKQLAPVLLFALSSSLYAKEKLSVRIIQRENSDTNYTYVVPSYTTEHSGGNANCYGAGLTVNCSATGRSSATTISARSGSYSVRGATLSLLLPDGRTAIVNCESKYAPKGDHINRRSCRTPLVDTVDAEFNKDNAKLEWTVSLDGKKMTTETYKILAVLDKTQ